MKKSLLRPKIIHVGDTYSISSLERKIESATEGLSSNCFNFLHNKVLPANKEIALVICDYISSLTSEINPDDGMNHEARDFVRGALLHLLDHLERDNSFVHFLNENGFLDQQKYDEFVTNGGKYKCDS